MVRGKIEQKERDPWPEVLKKSLKKECSDDQGRAQFGEKNARPFDPSRPRVDTVT